MENVTLDELLQAVEDASPRGGEGFTVAELRAFKPMGANQARELIRRAIASGYVRASRKPVTTIGGWVQLVPSYVVVKRRGRK